MCRLLQSLLYILLTFQLTTYASEKIELTFKEKAFLEKNPTIVLGSDSSWIPYVLYNQNGINIGLDSFILNKVNALTGANFQILTGEWHTILQRAKNSEIDGLSTTINHQSKLNDFNVSIPYLSINKTVIIASKNQQRIKNFHDLENKTIVLQKDNIFAQELLKPLHNVNLLEVEHYMDVWNYLIMGKADATIEEDMLEYIIQTKNIRTLKIIENHVKFPAELVFSIRQDWPEALSILNKALQKIDPEEIKQYKMNLLSTSVFKTQLDQMANSILDFTQEEQSFLQSKKNITMCIDPNWMPFEKNDKGKHVGMSADYFKIIEKKINTKITMIPTKTWQESLSFGQQRKCDIFSLIMHTKQRETFLNFTKPYLDIPLVLATNINEVFVNDISKVENKKIGITKAYAYGEILKEKYPKLQLVDVQSIEEGLQKVLSNELFGFIGSLSAVEYNIQQEYIGQLKITGKFDETWSLGVGVRNDTPLLTSIFNKAITSISEEEHRQILNKWLSVKYEKVSFTYLYEIVFLALLIIFFVLLINRRLFNEIEKRNKIQDYLNMIIKGAKLGTWTWDPKTNSNIINDNWANMLGYTKEEVDKIGTPFYFIFNEDKEKIDHAIALHQNGLKEMYEVEFRMKAKNGSIRWIHSCGSIVKEDENHAPLLYAGIHQDITDKKELENELKNKNNLFLQQSRQAAMGEMLENIAHQWRQPLSVITTSASGIKLKKEFEGTLSEKDLFDSLDQIIKSSMYLSQTIEDFRNFFRQEKVFTHIHFEMLFEKSLQFLQSKFINRNITIIKHIEDTTIYTLENELIQALINIFNNSVDALENSQEERFIFIKEFQEEKNFILQIYDTAGGISENIIYKIFDPYFTTKHKSQGTGIGLHMTQEIITKHLQGTIDVSNITFMHQEKEYKGALFTLVLPQKIIS